MTNVIASKVFYRVIRNRNIWSLQNWHSIDGLELFWSHCRLLWSVDKTRNMEHPGTFRNIPEHRIIMIIMRKKCANLNFGLARVTIWSAQIGHVGHVTCSFSQSRTTLLRNESYGRTFHRGKSIEKVYEVTDYWWYFEWRRECFNLVLPRKL